ncbi:hypothetical protein CAPTEDRAFT_206764 [Capitella teleta]|uniref:YitH/HolE acetyltransferase (GNAT) domain-containing protein n=1 Tax=Capitella teleta TaxID=283909 RepID=R7U5S3_CAPTE|nr:hypothetical protein CAPTEDRAFT_206764 [Capitella teleta]|eukprot:ELU01416.1 hypothetical protein CAPTEDRAFT_206764 [Capitella teleta]
MWVNAGLSTRERILRFRNEHASKNIVLSAVPKAVGFYAKCGFKLSDNKINYCIIHNPKPADTIEALGLNEIGPVSQDNMKKISEYDRGISLIDRLKYLSKWLLTPICQSYAVFDQQGRCVGYACFRVVDKYIKVQPLFADSVQIASHLMQHYLANNSSVIFLKLAVLNAD